MESVLHQSFDDYEYIIVDGKSTDGTLKIVDDYRQKFGGRLTVVSEPDNGIFDAMNKGISLSRGDIVGIINSDDYYTPNALQTIARAADEHPYQIIYGILGVLKNGMEVSATINRHEFIGEHTLLHPAVFVTRKIYTDFGGYNTTYKACADYDFFLRMSKNKSICFTPVYEVIAKMEKGGYSSTPDALVEAMKFRYENGLLGGVETLLQIMKIKIKKVLGFRL